MAKDKKKAIKTSAFHTKTYTIERIVTIPYSFVCENCKEEVTHEYKIRKKENYTVMVRKQKQEGIVNLDIPKEVVDEKYQIIDKQIKKQIDLLKATTDNNDFALLDNDECSNCKKNQSWKAKNEYYTDIFATSIVSLLIMVIGLLVGLITKTIFKNLALKLKTTFFIYLFNHSWLMGLLIGFIIALIYFLVKLRKYQNKRFNAENVDKKEKPIVHFEKMTTESMVYEALKDDRIKTK